MEYKLVVAVRDDLELSRGKLAVQVGHASVSAAFEARAKHARWFKAWMAEGQRKVVVRALDLDHLRELEARAKSLKLPTAWIEDAGLTELPPGTATCVGIGPGPDHLLDKVTGSLKLVGP